MYLQSYNLYFHTERCLFLVTKENFSLHVRLLICKTISKTRFISQKFRMGINVKLLYNETFKVDETHLKFSAQGVLFQSHGGNYL